MRTTPLKHLYGNAPFHVLHALPHFFQQPHRPPGGLPAPGRLPQSARAVSALTANGVPPRSSTLRFPFQKRHVAQICISRRNEVVPILLYPPTTNSVFNIAVYLAHWPLLEAYVTFLHRNSATRQWNGRISRMIQAQSLFVSSATRIIVLVAYP